MKALKVISLDDDKEFGSILKLKLRPPHYHLTLTHRSDEFLNKLAAESYDLILLDRNLGDDTLSGLAVLEHLRGQLDIKCPIFILSHFDDFKGIQDALELGADDYLTKPIDDFLFENKLKSFIHSELPHSLTRVPPQQSEIDLSAHTKIIEVNELGLKVDSPFFIRKSTPVKMSGPFIRDVLMKEVVSMSVGSSQIQKSRYLMHLDFDPEDKGLQDTLRAWLLAP